MDNLHVMITPKETKLVHRIAGRVYVKYCPAGKRGQIMREDLYHYGIIGLLEAKTRFESSKGVPWPAFAAFRIRGAMLDAIRKIPVIRLPQEKQQQVIALKKSQETFEKNGISPDPERLAKELGWSMDEVHEGLNLSPGVVTAEQHNDDTEGGGQRIILKDRRPNQESETMRKELSVVIDMCLEKLSDDSRIIFLERELEGVKLKDLAKTYNCSMETIRNWYKKACDKMKKCMEDNGFSLDALQLFE